jgi:hypothetical protein
MKTLSKLFCRYLNWHSYAVSWCNQLECHHCSACGHKEFIYDEAA